MPTTPTPLSALPPRTLVDQKTRITVLLTPVAKLQGLTVTQLEAGLDATCRLTKENTRFAPTGSETMEDSAVCEPAGAQNPGRSNFEATIGVYRFFDETGKASSVGDELFQAAKIKGTPLTFVIRRTSKAWDAPWAAGDEYQAYSVTTDNWQPQEDTSQGFIKATVPLFVSNAEINGVVATA